MWVCFVFLFFRFIFKANNNERLSDCFIKRNYVSIWNWIQKYKPRKILSKRKKIDEFIIDETLIKAGSSEYVWLWVAIEFESKGIIGFSTSKERNMLINERFISILVKMYGQVPI